MRDRFLQQEVWERMGVDVKEAVKLVMQDAPDRPIFQGMLFSKIVPNCKKLGLLDARRRLAARALHRARRDPVRGLGRHRRGVRACSTRSRRTARPRLRCSERSQPEEPWTR